LARVLVAVPIVSTRFLGGFEFSVLIFTDQFVSHIRNVKRVGRASIISPLASPLSLLAFGLSGKAREFIESIEKLRGVELREEDLRPPNVGKKSYTIRYSEVRKIRVSTGGGMVIEIHTSKAKHKHRVAVGLYKEIGKDKEEVYNDILQALKRVPAKVEISS